VSGILDPRKQLVPRKHLMAAKAVLVMVAVAIVSGSASSADDTGDRHYSVIHIPYGITDVQLTADGLRGVLVRAWRDNFNAHGFDVLSIYARPTSAEDASPNFLLVPVWEGDKERLELTSAGGADCRLTDFRFISTLGSDLQLVTAQREFGTSYADPAAVTFTYFTLKRNSSFEVGRPMYYFESTGSRRARKPYCDVEDAFAQELGLNS
jgi:hypothetical protein